MSDTDTNTNTSSDFELDNSIIEDINSLITTCHTLHTNIVEADNLLGNIKDSINMSDNISDTIYIMNGGVEMDFYDFLESLHKEAISNIEEGMPNSFEDALLNSIDKLV